MNKWHSTIFLKLCLTFLAILIISFALFASISYFLFKNNEEAWMSSRAFEQFETIENLLRQGEQANWDREMLQKVIESAIIDDNETLYFFDTEGVRIYQAGQLDRYSLIKENMIEQVVAGNTVHETDRTSSDGWFSISGAPLSNTGQASAAILVSLENDNRFAGTHTSFLWALIPTLLIITLLIFTVSKKITKPLKNMSEIAHNIAEGNFSERVEVKTKDEIGKLGHTLNFMADELENLEKTRRDFIANVSHDLRTPLTSLHGFLTALLDGTIPKQKEKYYLHVMKKQTERQMKLVNDLLELARMEADQMTIRPVAFNLSEEVRMIIARMDAEFIRRNVKIRLFMEEDEDIKVYADRNRIDQVITNLIQNAIQASPEKSKIDVRLKRKGEAAVFSVQDYGHGIKEENLKHIWQRFYKEDESRSTQVGTGIGLSIVKQVLDLHETYIDVESKEGKGTTFTFQLPISKKKHI